MNVELSPKGILKGVAAILAHVYWEQSNDELDAYYEGEKQRRESAMAVGVPLLAMTG